MAVTSSSGAAKYVVDLNGSDAKIEQWFLPMISSLSATGAIRHFKVLASHDGRAVCGRSVTRRPGKVPMKEMGRVAWSLPR